MAFFAGLLLRTMSIRDKNPLVQKTFLCPRTLLTKHLARYPILYSLLLSFGFDLNIHSGEVLFFI